MKKELSVDYDVTVDNMLDMSNDQEVGPFKVTQGTFFNKSGKEVKKNILEFDDDENFVRRQIFSMKDGTFVLELEVDMEVTYFYSEDLNDLI